MNYCRCLKIIFSTVFGKESMIFTKVVIALDDINLSSNIVKSSQTKLICSVYSFYYDFLLSFQLLDEQQ
ncbi:hypothetical protein E5S67_01237 [Microcoleus sp. IPMA8]|uniref:Uncharacterized protein n=1 Tax=Microcoleus asticus IPMA8 TaxID=2563858 RepID=A0ABX2CTR2_9CYAN|nr:hypothetical protein [Microcoleus asticus IPMA8]